MLTDDDWQPLRAAVSSFDERWRAFVEQPWYESDPSYAVSELARHLVDEASAVLPVPDGVGRPQVRLRLEDDPVGHLSSVLGPGEDRRIDLRDRILG